jgi:hypothetical protein
MMMLAIAIALALFLAVLFVCGLCKAARRGDEQRLDTNWCLHQMLEQEWL